MRAGRASHAGALEAALAAFDRGQPLVVAFSGGIDSSALLHALVRVRAGRTGRLRALHVDHAMQPGSIGWALHCAQICARLGVALETVEVEVTGADRDGPEAAARRARMVAFAGRVRPGETLVTAHHADDQVETVLIALARGSGPAGLAGIRVEGPLGAGSIARPLLGVPAAALRAYVAEAGIAWVNDPTNADACLARGLLRARVMPALREHWPGLDRAVARAASHQARTTELLDALAGLDLDALAGPGQGTLSRTACAAFDPPRLDNALRRWLAGRGLPVPAARHLERLVCDVIHSRLDAEPVVRWPGAEVRRHGDILHAMRPLREPPQGPTPWPASAPLVLAHGRLELEPAVGLGLAASLVASQSLEVGHRRGGERCRPSGRAHSQTLRRLFQEHHVAPWERDRVPLLYRRGELIAVAGLWICEGFQAAPGAPGLVPRWFPAD